MTTTRHPRSWISCALLLTITALGGAAERHDVDVVVLSNGHQITGKVTAADEQRVTISQDHGQVQLPRLLIDTVHLGFASRLERLDRGDYEAVIALAMWAKDRGLLAEAQELAELAWTLDAVDGRAALLVAQLLDSQAGKQQEALTYYRAWRDRFGGTEASVINRINTLENHFRAYEEALAAHRQRLAEAQTNHVEGLESRGGWQGDDPQHANPIAVEPRSIDDSGITNTVLEVRFSGGQHDKATLRRRVTFDATVHNSFTFEISNPSAQPLPVSLAIKAGAGYIYHESTTVTVPPNSGWFPVTFSFTANDWKSQASNWAHNTTISDADNVREIQILLHNRRRDGVVLVDNIPLLR